MRETLWGWDDPRPGARPDRRRGRTVLCGHCAKPFYAHRCEPTRRFCSKSCHDRHRTKYPRTARPCAACGREFLASVKPHSNSSGRYCSMECRNKGYLGKYRGRPTFGWRGPRPGWRSIARKHLARQNDFCVACGKNAGTRLLVHHIEPYRIAQNNDPTNLVTSCPKCHPKLERISDRIALLPPERRELAVLLVASMLEDRWHLHQGRRLMRRSA